MPTVCNTLATAATSTLCLDASALCNDRTLPRWAKRVLSEAMASTKFATSSACNLFPITRNRVRSAASSLSTSGHVPDRMSRARHCIACAEARCPVDPCTVKRPRRPQSAGACRRGSRTLSAPSPFAIAGTARCARARTTASSTVSPSSSSLSSSLSASGPSTGGSSVVRPRPSSSSAEPLQRCVNKAGTAPASASTSRAAASLPTPVNATMASAEAITPEA
mmetsp:Transcript_34297/g.91644  ORF Transcript_34297/g.91644 Transcript_34297/m.91644 type:complete len:222 (+) Transcript_34297:179-844(+)